MSKHSDSQTIIRTVKDRTNPYVMINCRLLDDQRLTWEARGLASYLLSKPDNWDIRIEHLIDQAPGGRDRLYRILGELKTYGYLRREQVRGEGGRFEWITHLYEVPPTPAPYPAFPYMAEPDTAAPHTAKPDTAEPDTEKPDLLVIIESLNTDAVNTDSVKMEEGVAAAVPAIRQTALPPPPPPPRPLRKNDDEHTPPSDPPDLAAVAVTQFLELYRPRAPAAMRSRIQRDVTRLLTEGLPLTLRGLEHALTEAAGKNDPWEFAMKVWRAKPNGPPEGATRGKPLETRPGAVEGHPGPAETPPLDPRAEQAKLRAALAGLVPRGAGRPAG